MTTDAWSKMSPEKRRKLKALATELVSGSIIEGAAAQFLAMVICEACEVSRDNERGKWMDAIAEYFDGQTAEAVRAYTEDRGTRMEMSDE